MKTHRNGYKPIKSIGMGSLTNNPEDQGRWYANMYKIKKENDESLTKDLILSGGHGILVQELDETQLQKHNNKQWSNQSVDGLSVIPCGLSDKFEVLPDHDNHSYFQFILENDGNLGKRYGVYANGLLVETPPEYLFNKGVFEEQEHQDVPIHILFEKH